MPTLDTVDLTAVAEAVRDASNLALQADSAEDFELIERRINELEAVIREQQQSMWANEVKQAIRHLEDDQPLSDSDLEVIRVFLVSDAEHYLAQENNYNDWVHELQRLLDETVSRVGTLARESIGELRGVLKDAIHLVPDIRNYLDERRRVKLFERGLDNLDRQTRSTLAQLLKDQLRNPNM